MAQNSNRMTRGNSDGMEDQAHTLRRLARPQLQDDAADLAPPPSDVRVISITSGKGGVGKTHIVVNLAYALQRLGARVMVLDADLGLANIDVLLGLAPRFNIQHVLTGDKALADILLPGPAGMIILPAGSGVHDLAQLTDSQRLRLLEALDALELDLDFLLIDTGAGISTNVMYFNMAAQDIVIVATPEPTSLTDAYAVMKVLATQYAEKYFKVVVNMVTSAAEAKEAFRRLSMVTERFLNISIDYLGFILHDSAFPQAVRQQQALLQLYPHAPAARCLYRLAQRVLDLPMAPHPKGNIQFFWQRLLTGHARSSPEALQTVQAEPEGIGNEGVGS
jgi:flagellar biosynthesis protein FlhG